MGKRKYRATKIQEVNVSALLEALTCEQLVVAIDVAKEHFFAAFVHGNATQQVIACVVRWRHPEESSAFLELCKAVAENATVEVALEPTGTYGDALRYQLWGAGLSVFKVSPKMTFDGKEIYDGVPSLHDAKSAAVISWLHLQGRSTLWPVEPMRKRQLDAALREVDMHRKFFEQNRNRLEGLLARYWPELTRYLALNSQSLLALLTQFGGPAEVAARREEAAQLMHSSSCGKLAPEKIAAVLASAGSSVGLAMIAEEQRMLRAVAGEAKRSRVAANSALKRVEALVDQQPVTRRLAEVIGKRTAAVVVAALGEPQRYNSAKAYEKSAGLNLREKSSGQLKGGLHITKRGSSVARVYLYFAVLRLLQSDPVLKAWYLKKVKRQGGQGKRKAVVAVMRKLVRALWHVGRGAQFDSRLLFDTRRLRLGEQSTTTG